MQHCYKIRFNTQWLKPLALFAIVCSFLLGSNFAIAKPDFKTWLQQIKQEAIAAGISTKTATATIQHIRWLPKVIEIDQKQPEFVSTFQGYHHSHITPVRVFSGKKQLRTYAALLKKLQQQYGIPPTILVALWGLETNYGGFKGNTDVVSALATLAYEGRRAAFFKAQLFDAMKIIDEHQLPFSYLNGSWAGAFGHMQFMPSTFRAYAINGDANQRIDIKRSIPDALYSAANYLASVGWRTDEPVAIQVRLPSGFNYGLAQLKQRKSLATWALMGVQVLDAHLSDQKFKLNHRAYRKQPLAHRQKAAQYHVNSVRYQPLTSLGLAPETKAGIILPQGWNGPAFMVFDNFDTVMHWNRSINYALSVSFLAKQIMDQTVVWIKDQRGGQALSRLQMQRLQRLLKQFGFDPGPIDGYPGLKTQTAVRQYQQAMNLPADGYASLQLYHHLDRQSFIKEGAKPN